MCSTYWLHATRYDACWLMHGIVLVTAEPMSTIHDPNPLTCKSLLPCTSTDGVHPKSAKSPKVHSSKLVKTPRDIFEEHEDLLRGSQEDLPLPLLKDFVTWVQDMGVGHLVRANTGVERGLENIGTYDCTIFTTRGISHLDNPVLDTGGAVPSAADVRRVLQSCEAPLQSSKAVLLHCKGGFGRSVVLATCLAIYLFDVPDRVVLGWCRIVRPGAVTTPQQELFLVRLNGKEDVERYAFMHQSCCAVS